VKTVQQFRSPVIGKEYKDANKKPEKLKNGGESRDSGGFSGNLAFADRPGEGKPHERPFT